ncbi:MAG: hypothetical protein ACXVQ7_02620 [Actinomycetota bacterium]
MKTRPLLVLGLVGIGGFALGAARTSDIFRVLVLIVAIAAGTWVVRGVVERMTEQQPEREGRRRRVDTYWPARCSHCGIRGGPRLRMVAGRDAYICELCLRRGVELLDSPDDITRFI